jgi:hypothetical protein
LDNVGILDILMKAFPLKTVYIDTISLYITVAVSFCIIRTKLKDGDHILGVPNHSLKHISGII